MAVLQRRFDNPRIAVGPVGAAAGDQAHAIPLALHAEDIVIEGLDVADAAIIILELTLN